MFFLQNYQKIRPIKNMHLYELGRRIKKKSHFSHSKKKMMKRTKTHNFNTFIQRYKSNSFFSCFDLFFFSLSKSQGTVTGFFCQFFVIVCANKRVVFACSTTGLGEIGLWVTNMYVLHFLSVDKEGCQFGNFCTLNKKITGLGLTASVGGYFHIIVYRVFEFPPKLF